MKIAILGYGLEGKAAEKYFTKPNNEIQIFDPFTGAPEEIAALTDFDLVLRSPSIPPRGDWSSGTKYFFQHCPCPIIGVTGTKGKGTTCSLITALLEALGRKVWLVGNIGKPALEVLDQIQPHDVVVYEMSSFQLWDLEQSPQYAVVLRIEPDHLNVHKDYDDYVRAKSHIATHQTADDFCVFYAHNPDSVKIARKSLGTKLTYPTTEHRALMDAALAHLSIVGPHNRENAEAALTIVATFMGETLPAFLQNHTTEIAQGLHNFHGLPHRLEFVREHNNIKYYDDNFATNLASTTVALQSFPEAPIVLIAGGRDKTNNADLPDLAELINHTSNLHKVVLMGESGHALYAEHRPNNAILAESLGEAVQLATDVAATVATAEHPAIVLMSPAAASFDLFKNVYDRGAQYQKIIKELR